MSCQSGLPEINIPSFFPGVDFQVNHVKLGGGFKYVLFSPRNLGKIFNLTNIFQDGLKPPTS